MSFKLASGLFWMFSVCFSSVSSRVWNSFCCSKSSCTQRNLMLILTWICDVKLQVPLNFRWTVLWATGYKIHISTNFLTWTLFIFPDVAWTSSRTSRDRSRVSDWIKFAASGSSRPIRGLEATRTSPTLLCKSSAASCNCCQWASGKTIS